MKRPGLSLVSRVHSYSSVCFHFFCAYFARKRFVDEGILILGRVSTSHCFTLYWLLHVLIETTARERTELVEVMAIDSESIESDFYHPIKICSQARARTSLPWFISLLVYKVIHNVARQPQTTIRAQSAPGRKRFMFP